MIKKLSLWEALGSPANFPNYEDNVGGLGTIKPTYNLPRQASQDYPYKNSSESEDTSCECDNEDEEGFLNKKKISNKLGDTNSVDFYSFKKTDNQYHTPNASTRFDMMKLGEAIGTRSSRTSLVPYPNLYKDKQASFGGANSWNANHKDIQHTTGTKHGWSMAHKELEDASFEFNDEKNVDNDPVRKIRQIVKAYHDLNLIRV